MTVLKSHLVVKQRDPVAQPPHHVPVIAVDFDGRIAEWRGDFDLGQTEPRKGARETLTRWHDAGIRLVIWTGRPDEQETRAWLDKEGFPYDAFNENPWYELGSRKIVADLYIDDRGEGDPDTPWKDLDRLVEERLCGPQPPRQPVADWDGLAALARRGGPELWGLLKGALGFRETSLPGFLLSPSPDRIVIAPPKKYRRAEEKVEEDYDGDWGRLLDVVRCSVVVESVGDLRDAVKRVLDAGARYARLPEDRLDRPLANGYRDYRANYRLPCGLVCEVQYHTAETLLERERDHKRYEVTRELTSWLVTKGDGSCKPGQTAAATGCTPASGGGSGGAGNGLQDVISGRRKPTAAEYGELLDQGYEWSDEGGWVRPETPERAPASPTVDQKVHNDAARGMRDEERKLAEISHGWEDLKPWNMTADQIRQNAPPGVKLTKNPRGEAAHYADGTVWLSPKFFEPPYSNHEEARRHILYHELGHMMADTMIRDGTSFQLHDAGVIPAEHDLGSGTGGGHGDEEALADAFALLHTDPDWLKNKYPDMAEVVRNRARALGMPVGKSLRERDHGRYEVTRECRKGLQSYVGNQQSETLLDAAIALGRPDYALRSVLTGPVAPEEVFTKGESMNVQKGTPEGPYRSPWSSGDWYLVTDIRGKDVVWVVVQNGRQRSEFPPHQSRRDALAWLRDNGYELKKTIKSWL